MFARGLLSFHLAPFPGSQTNLLSPIISTLARPSGKSNRRYHFHDTQGGVSCCQPHSDHYVSLQPPGYQRSAKHRELSRPKLFPSPAYKRVTGHSFVSPAYAKTGGCTLPRKCRRADIFDFFPYILRFFACRLALLGPPTEHRAQATIPAPLTVHRSRDAGRWPLSLGQTNVNAAGGRNVLQRYFSLREAAARMAESRGWAWSKGSERRKRSARRAWLYLS